MEHLGGSSVPGSQKERWAITLAEPAVPPILQWGLGGAPRPREGTSRSWAVLVEGRPLPTLPTPQALA